MSLLTVVLIASSIALALAQPSAECINAYNVTFNSGDRASCAQAYFTLFLGAATEEQRMMVCDEGQQCNTWIENIISICGNSIESPTISTQRLVCASNSDGDTCISVITNATNNLDLGTAFDTLGESCIFGCSDTCYQSLTTVRTAFGCCLTETLEASVESGEATSAQASLITSTFPLVCGMEPFSFCNGTAVQASACGNASVALFGPNDTCSQSVQALFAGDSTQTINLFNGDCPTRFQGFTDICAAEVDSPEIMELGDSVVAISQARSPNGRACSELVPIFLGMDDSDDDFSCTDDYFLGRCSDACKNILLNFTAEYGCCLNSILSEFTGRSDEDSDQIEYAILTRNIYSLCEITNPGFCGGVTPQPYSDLANRCVSVRNTFFANDACLDYYRELGLRTSASAVDSAAHTICASQSCSGRMRGYVNYLLACRVGNDEDEDDNDDDDDDDDDDQDTGYLDLAYLTGNTTCRVDSNNNTCFSSIYFNQVYSQVSDAFDEENPAAICASVFATPASCSSACSQLLRTALNTVGCCVGEFGRALSGADSITTVARECDVPIDNRCSALQAGGGGGGGGANIQKGFGVLTILLFGVIANIMA